MAKKQKYYVVWKGIKTGIFDSWKECESQVKGYIGARYKSFDSIEAAEYAYQSGPYTIAAPKKNKTSNKINLPIKQDSIAVDAACEGNPGLLEYQGMDLATGTILFHIGPLEEGTNNLGEFLAIVHALALFKKENKSNKVIYSDSLTGIAWVRNKRIKSTLQRTKKNEPLFKLVDRAITWLHTNTYSNSILKWETEEWGENPADFGRK
ncbi:MAG: ribonuclease H family protein [Saprospiraceae bacterium]